MLELGLMIEGQNGLTWERWGRILRAAERLGFAAVYRNDHFMNPSGPALESLELWSSLTWAATQTERIEFGPLVCPFSFRHPVVTAWSAAAIDDLSGGRLQLGLGLGWNEREHRACGFELLPLPERFRRFAEGVAIVHALLHDDDPISFDGEHFRIEDAQLLPRPSRPGGPPIVIGGNGPNRTLPLAARFAREWNAVAVAPDRFRELNARLDALLLAEGRDPAAVRRSVMAQCIVASSVAEAEARWPDLSELRARGGFAGAPDGAIEHLRAYEAAGVQRVILRWLELDDLPMLELIGREVIPALR
jgi:F420-dependent oxidoreductase-like protein